MNVRPKPAFLRHIGKISNQTVRASVDTAILSVMRAPTIREIPDLKKLKGYRISYRIKVGDYRIGVEIENNIVTFVAFGHRKDIYKFFP